MCCGGEEISHVAYETNLHRESLRDRVYQTEWDLYVAFCTVPLIVVSCLRNRFFFRFWSTITVCIVLVLLAGDFVLSKTFQFLFSMSNVVLIDLCMAYHKALKRGKGSHLCSSNQQFSSGEDVWLTCMENTKTTVFVLLLLFVFVCRYFLFVFMF